MSRSGVVVLLISVGMVAACSKGDNQVNQAPEHVFLPRLAWAGIGADGLRVVVEPVAEAAQAQPAIDSEESLLRRSLHLNAGQQMLRLHLQPSPESQLPKSAGKLLVAADIYAPLDTMPEGLDAQGRLIWQSAVQGGRAFVTDPGELQRWSLLMVATTKTILGQQDKLIWQADEQHVELTSYSWNEVERQQFLEATLPVEDE